MNFASRWFGAAVAASFAAGLVVGLSAPHIVGAFARDETGNRGADPYVRRLIDDYCLTTDQQSSLRMIWDACQSEFYEAVDSLPSARIDRLRAEVSERANQRIRQILDPEQRARFDREVASANPTGSGGG